MPVGERGEYRAFLPATHMGPGSSSTPSKVSREGQERKPGMGRIIKKSNAGFREMWLLTLTLPLQVV